MSVPDVFGTASGGSYSRLLFEACPDAVLVIDDQGTILFANPAVERVFGHAPDDIAGGPLSILQPERLREGHRLGLARYLATGDPKLDWRATRTFGLHRDGHEFPVEIAFTALAPRRFGGFIRDVSARVEIERALADSEASYRDLLDNANDLVYTHDLQGNFTYANQAAARTYGWSVEELTSMNITSLVDPDHLETARAKTMEKLAGGGDTTSPYPILTHGRDGGDIWVEVNTRLLRDADGAPVGVQGIARDITARRAIEEQLARERELRDRVMESSPNAIAAVDLEGRITLANRRFCETTGYAQHELLGLTFGAFIAESSLPVVGPVNARVLAGEPIDDLEFDAVRKDGSTFRARATLRPLMEGGVVTGVIGVTEDITERKRADEELKGAQEFRDRVLDTTTNAIAAFDLEGRATLVNKRLCEITGFAEEEILGHALRDVVRANVGEKTFTQRVIEGERIEGVDLDGFHKDGTPITVRISMRPLMDNDRVVGVIGTAEDVTERKRDEEALRRASELRDRVLDASTNAIAVFDRDGLVTLVNKRICEMTGYAEEELLGQRFHHLVRPGAKSMIPKALRLVLEGESIDGFEFEGRRKDGESFRARATLRPLMEGDRIVGVVGTAEDITEERQREEALTRTRELRDRVLESTTNAIGAFDIEGRLTLVNQRLCEMTGYTQDELLGSKLWTLIVPGATDEIRPALQRVLEGESFDDVEFAAVRKDGTRFVARAALRPIYEDGAIVGLIGTAEDITERKANDELLASQRQLLEMIAVGAPLTDVLREIAMAVERQAPGWCSILLLDDDGRRLRPGAAPSLPQEAIDFVDGLEVGPAVGTCGAAVHRGEPIITEDTAADPNWDQFREFAEQFNIAACWSTPIVAGTGTVIGTFAMYYNERHAPSAHENQIVGVLSHIAGIAIERDRAQTQAVRQTNLLAEKSALLEAALASERERARRDPLTGALNHAVIADEVRRLIDDRDTGSFVLAMVDVDGLKAVNDTYGHQMGDQVLLAVASALRREGAIVGRYGGDEFVAILPDADREAAVTYRDRVAETLAAVDVRDPDTRSRIQINASIGLAIYPEEGDAVEDLIKLSDSAMYASRRQRADTSAPAAFARIHGGDRAAEIVGEIVPFLTSPGNLQEKLNLVAARVSAGAGYDGVNFALYGNTGPAARTASFSPDSSEAAAQYDEEALPPEEPGPMRQLLEATRRPVIIDDIATTEFATPSQKQILDSVGLKSAMVVPMIWRGVLVGSLSVASKRPAAFGPRDAQFLVAIATQVTSIVRTAALVDDLQSASNRLQEAQTETVLMLAAAAEAHDDTTGRHLQRVRGIAQSLALELGHSAAEAKEIGLAAVLHDIGKIRVPDYVLASSASLSDAEWALMKEHTVWGSEFLGSRGGFELAMQVARSHHERWDGSGYPDGIAGPMIPEPAAITSVADSLDAMISDRPYRPGRPLEDAIAEIEAWSGRQFSPKVVEALLGLYHRGELAYLTDDKALRRLAA